MFAQMWLNLLHLLLYPMLHLNYSLTVMCRKTVYIQVIFQRKRYLKSTGVKCSEENFDKSAQDFRYVKRQDKLHEYKNQQIRKAYQDAEASILEVLRKYGSLSADLLKLALENKYAKAQALIDYMDRYIEVTKLAPNTERRYRAIIRVNFSPKYSKLAVVEVTPKWCAHFHQELIAQGYASTTIWTVFKFLKSALGLAREDIDFAFPIGSQKGQYKMPPYKNPDRFFLSTDQISQLKTYYDSLNPVWRNASRWFVLQTKLGCRASDLLNFRKHEIKDGRYYLSDVKTKNQHYIPLYPALVEALQALERPIGSYDKYNKALREIGQDMGLLFKLTTHVARHTFAVSSINSSVRTEFVMKAMGIKKASTFAVYGKFTDDQMDKEFGKL
jgi:integrase